MCQSDKVELAGLGLRNIEYDDSVISHILIGGYLMSQVIVRNLEDGVKAGLKRRALRHGWSMEEEARQILRNAVLEDTAVSAPLGSRIAARFAGVGLHEDLPELHGQDIAGMEFDS